MVFNESIQPSMCVCMCVYSVIIIHQQLMKITSWIVYESWFSWNELMYLEISSFAWESGTVQFHAVFKKYSWVFHQGTEETKMAINEMCTVKFQTRINNQENAYTRLIVRKHVKIKQWLNVHQNQKVRRNASNNI